MNFEKEARELTEKVRTVMFGTGRYEDVEDLIRAALQSAQAKPMRALESLTPSGSEFVGDPEACVAFVRHKFESDMNYIRKQAAKIKDLQSASASGSGRELRDKAWVVLHAIQDNSKNPGHSRGNPTESELVQLENALLDYDQQPIPASGGWVSVKERLPEKRQQVLIWWTPNNKHDPDHCRFGEVTHDGHWRPEGGNGNFDDRVTHWQPLPEPPAETTLNTHDLGTCLRFANGETCVGCGDEANGEELICHCGVSQSRHNTMEDGHTFVAAGPEAEPPAEQGKETTMVEALDSFNQESRFRAGAEWMRERVRVILAVYAGYFRSKQYCKDVVKAIAALPLEPEETK